MLPPLGSIIQVNGHKFEGFTIFENPKYLLNTLEIVIYRKFMLTIKVFIVGYGYKSLIFESYHKGYPRPPILSPLKYLQQYYLDQDYLTSRTSSGRIL